MEYLREKRRHRLERHDLDAALFAEIKAHLQAQGQRRKRGTIRDASFITAPSVTKSTASARGPELPQTKQGKQYCGMKAPIGVDAESGLPHPLATTPANGSAVARPWCCMARSRRCGATWAIRE